MIIKFIKSPNTGKWIHPITALPVEWYKEHKDEAERIAQIDKGMSYSDYDEVKEIEI